MKIRVEGQIGLGQEVQDVRKICPDGMKSGVRASSVELGQPEQGLRVFWGNPQNWGR